MKRFIFLFSTLAAFLFCGGGLFSACKHQTVDPACDVSNVKYSADVHTILQSNCQSCHNDAAPTENVSVQDYEDVKKSVDSGKLLSQIKDGKMPPSGKLPDCQISKIEKWIQNGAPNN